MLLLPLLSFRAGATDVLVTSPTDILLAAAQAQPGDNLIMRNGVWPDATILFKANGTATNPITLRAQTPGQVLLTGGSSLGMAGNYLVVSGLKFANGYVLTGDVISFRIAGSGGGFANNSRVTDCAIIDYNPDIPDESASTLWVSIYGLSNRVDHCYIRGKGNDGSTVAVVLQDGGPPNYHNIDHNYFAFRPPLSVNGGETVRVGDSGTSTNISRTTVEYNYFEQCNGDVEIITSKSCQNTFRHNTFVDCEGHLSLRHGNGSQVYGNYFFGHGKPLTGGVRIIAEDHLVYNNYFDNLAGSAARAALSIMQGLENSPLNGYFQVKRATVAFNTFVNCSNTMIIGLSGTLTSATNVTTLPPVDCTIANNLALVSSGKMVDQRITPVNLTWQGNILYGSTLSIPLPSGIVTNLDPGLALAPDGLYRPAAGSPALGAAQGAYPFVTDDMEGQSRPSTGQDVGCDQFSGAPIVNPPLGPADAEPSWMLPGSDILTWSNPTNIVYGRALGVQQLNASANVSGTYVYTPPAGTVLSAGANQTLTVVFTPRDALTYSVITQSVTINVLPATPQLVWGTPTNIIYGTPLSGAQLFAAASVPGQFSYNPPAGTVLDAASAQILTVTFTATDTNNYNVATKTVTLGVLPATPIITWPDPAPIESGTLLGPAQLNATANAAGTFAYDPPSGTVLNPGSGILLTAVFSPSNPNNYLSATQTVMIDVTSGGKLVPNLTWSNPADISAGTPLGPAQLNASAEVAGTFVYNPPPGTLLSPGNRQALSVTFLPSDTNTYAAVSLVVRINVTAPLNNSVVRVAYLLPTNRVAQAAGVANLKYAISLYQRWFADQMQRNGFGPKPLAFETEGDGVTPKVYTVAVAQSDVFLRGDFTGGRVLDAAKAAGLNIGASGQIWWLVPEIHGENPDGSIIGGFDLGSNSSGSADGSGWAITGSDALPFWQDAMLTNNTPYDGTIVPDIGPYPLQQDVSYPFYDGMSLSSISSAALGAGLRDLGQALGLDHDFRNDENFDGNFMGFGFTGIRGAVYPQLYPYNYTFLSYGAALALNGNPLFNFGQPSSGDTIKPTLSVQKSGPISPVNGLLRINFSASDAGGLSAALLSWSKDSDTDLVEEIPIAGNAINQAFATAYFDSGVTNVYTISVFDLQGNKAAAATSLFPINVGNQAPQPFITASPRTVGLGEDVVLDASGSFDSQHDSSLLEVEWDLDGDGIFDTLPQSSLLFTNQYYTVGSRLVRARLSDPAGAMAISAPVAVNVKICHSTLKVSSKQHGSGATTNTVVNSSSPQCVWTAVSQNDWITVLGSGSFTGTAGVTYSLTENTSLNSRIGGIQVADQFLTITQSGVTCSFSFSPTNRFVGFGATGNSVKMTAKAPDCGWTLVENADWLTITSPTSGFGSATNTFTVTANKAFGKRQATVSVGGQFFTVTQWGTNCEYLLSPASWVMGPGSDTGMVSVAANSGCSWTVGANTNNWITLTDNTSGSGSGTIGFRVSANPGMGGRTGVLTIAGQPWVLTQQACSIAVSPPSLAHGYGADVGSITVTAAASCGWPVVNTNTWIRLTTPSVGSGNGVVSYSVDPNPFYRAQTGVITIGNQSVTITQAGLPCNYGLSETDPGFDFDENINIWQVDVTAPSLDCVWTVVNTNAWITIISSTNSAGNDSVIFLVAANTGLARIGNLLVAGIPYTITQARGARLIQFGNFKVASGQTVCAPLTVETHGDENSLNLGLCYDPSLLQFVSASLDTGGAGGTLSVISNQVPLGQVGLTWTLPPGWSAFAGIRPLAQICFVAPFIFGNATTAVSFCDQPVQRQMLSVIGQPDPLIFSNSTVQVIGFCTLAESLDAPTLAWTTDAGAPWLCQTAVTSDGVDAAQSGAIGDSGSSSMQTSASGPGTINFLWKVSSEPTNDTLRFLIGSTEQARISGEAGWEQRSFRVSGGIQVLKWTYSKNTSLSSGQDRAWVDQVQFVPDPASITTQPASLTLDMGGTAVFSVGTTGAPVILYQWQFNGVNLSDGNGVSGSSTATLRLANVQPAQSGSYSVAVSNAVGGAVSSSALLAVTALVPLADALDTPPGLVWITNGSPPWVGQGTVTHDGVDAARSGAIADGQTNSFQTTVTGPGTVSFWWKVSSETNKDFLQFSISNSLQAQISGEVDWINPTFTVPSGSQTLQWRYAKNGSLSAGQDRAWVDQVQFIPAAPAITAQPVGQNVDAGAIVSFNVAATGGPPLSYQWQFNGTSLTDGGNISGSTTTNLTLVNVQPGQAGSYSVVVSNATRSVASAGALLTVATLVPLPEALDATSLLWTTNGTSGWVGQTAITHDSVDAARSGALGNSASNSMQTTVTGPVTVSFWWKISSETNNDILRFSVDGFEQARISGEVDWTFRSFDLGPGPGIRVLQWTYAKNGSLSNGQDRAWVDQVTLGPAPAGIVAQPAGQAVEIGGSVAFNVSAVGTAPLGYQWRFNGASLADGVGISGSASPNLTLSNVQPGQSGNYSVVVTNISGSVTSAPAFLSVVPLIGLSEALDTPTWTWTTNGTPPWVGQSIVSHDLVDAARSGAIADNGSTSVQTIQTGPGAVSFWWKVSSETNNDVLIFSIGGVEQARISGEVDWQFRTFPISSSTPVVLQWTYAKNGSLSGGQDRAWLDQVQFVPGVAGFPIITSQPASQTGGENGTAAFAVGASGAVPLSYQWLFNGAALASSTSAVGVATSTLLVSNITSALAGSYAVRVSNAVGVVTSSVAALTVIAFTDAINAPWAVVAQGGTPPAWFAETGVTHDGVAAVQSGAIPAGVFTKFETHVIGPGPLTFWWKISSLTNDGILSLTIGSTVVAQISGEVDWTQASFTVPSSGSTLLKFRYQKGSSASAGQDAAWVDQIQFGTNSVPGPPTPPSITSQPVSQSVVSPATVTFTVGANGSAPLSYQWQFNGVNLANGGNVSGATTASLTLSSVTAAQAGAYSVVVTNAAGTATSSNATLAVVTAPVITSQPASQSLVAGSTVSFSVTAVGLAPLVYQWRLNGANLANSGNISGATTSSLKLTNVLVTQAGAYSVVVSNSAGFAASSDALLIVGAPPAVTSQPLSQTVAAGANVTFAVLASGVAPLSYRWRLNGTNLADGGAFSGTASSSLSVSNAQAAQAGPYSVVVSNPLGSATSSNALLAVLSPPNVTSQPSNRSVAEGVAVSFTVGAAGSAPLTYQWRLNGANLVNGALFSGVTNATLVLTNARPAQAGNYTVLVSNLVGVTISSNAVLAVKAALTLGEALNASYLAWNTSLSAPWVVQTNLMHGGPGAARSGAISNSQNSWIETSVVGPGVLRFWWKVSSETNKDVLQFLVNGTPFDGISGEADWQERTFNLTAGNQVLRWIYTKDASGTAGQDRAWLDEVEFTPTIGPVSPVIMSQPLSQVVTPGATASFSVEAMGTAPLSYQWHFNGEVLGDSETVSGSTSDTLILANVGPNQQGVYTVVVKNNYSTTTATNAILTLTQPITLADALDTTNKTWIVSGASQWFGQTAVNHDWVDAARTGPLLNNQSNAIETTVAGPSAVTFWWKVSSATNHGRLRFLINGIEQVNISGEVPWQWRTFDLTNLTQVVRWVYSKDTNAPAGADAGWLDQVQFGPSAPSILRQPEVQQLADLGATVNINVSVLGSRPINYQWNFNGINLVNDTNTGGAILSSLFLTNVQPAQAGFYNVAATTAGGRVISSNSTLNVSSGQPLAQALNASNFLNSGFISRGSAFWFPEATTTHDGVLALQSGSIGDAQQTSLETTLTGPGTLRFWWLVDSQANVPGIGGVTGDRLSVRVGGVQQAVISGQTNWQLITLSISNGAQLIEWRYAKDAALASGADAAWVDQVQYAQIFPPVFTNQPASTNVDPGTTVSFSAAVTGTPPYTYQWLRNGAVLPNGNGVSGATTPTLTLANVQAAQVGSYMLAASNAAALVLSSNAVLSVTPTLPLGDALDQPAWTWVTVGSPPWLGQSVVTFDGVDAARNAAIGDGVSTSIQTTQSGPGLLYFYWKVSSEPNGDFLSFYINNTLQSQISGERDWFQVGYVLPAGPLVFRWTYSKNASISAGLDQGFVDNLVFYGVGPTITSSPASQTVDAGASVSFSVSASGTPPFFYQWQLNGNNLVNGAGVSGANSATLSLANVQLAQAGSYSVIVSNAWGSVPSPSASLGVTPLFPLPVALDTPTWIWVTNGTPPWVGQPLVSVVGGSAARSGAIGNSTTTSMQTTQSGPGTVTFWWKVSSETNNDALIFYAGSSGTTEQGRISGEVDWQQRSFNIGSGTQILKWTYSKNSSVTAGQDRAWVDQVQFGPTPPAITNQPASQSVDQGATVSFNVVAGAGPLTYQWQYNGAKLANGSGVAGVNSATLTLSNVQPGQSGNYSVIVSNAATSITSSNAFLAVATLVPLADALDALGVFWTTNGTPPWVGQTAVTHDGVDAGRSGAIGNNATNSMQTTVTGPLTVSFWWKVSSETNNDTLRFLIGGVEQARISGEVDWRFVSFNVGASNQVLQWVYAKNGSVTSGQDRGWVDQVTFGNVPPAIIVPPVGQAVDMGSTVSFSALAGGTPPLTYRWQLEGDDLFDGPGISGSTTPNLVLSNVQPGQSGNYSVIVVNNAGSIVSASALLTVATITSLTEALDTPGWTWTTNGTSGWVGQTAVTHDTVDAARSNPLGNGASNSMQTTVTGPATLSFWWKVSSETNNDVLRFTIGGVEKARISGEVDWQFVTLNIGASNAVLQWTYAKNGNVAGGQDRAWVDQVTLGPTPPGIVSQPSPQKTEIGGSAAFNVVAAGTAPLIYQWLFNGASLSDSSTISGSATPTLSLSNLQPGQSGNYSVLVTNASGSITSLTAFLSITPLLPLPDALDTPDWPWTTSGNPAWVGQSVVSHDGAAAARSGTIGDNSSTSVLVTTNGPGTISFWWKVSSETNNDVLIFSIGGVEQARISGEVNWQFRTFALPTSSPVPLQWTYAKNGSVSSGQDRAWLDQVQFTQGVPGFPLITSQPSAQTGGENGTAAFTVGVTGASPLSYQWLFNGAALANSTSAVGVATSTLVVSNIMAAQAGGYSVQVSNSVGVVTSSVAPLSFIGFSDALNAPLVAFVQGGTPPAWFAETSVTHDGVAAVQSGAIPTGVFTKFETHVIAPTTLNFWWKVSSLTNSGVLSLTVGSTVVAQISGEVDWTPMTIPVTGSGSTLLKFRYQKSGGVGGADAGWFDQLVFPGSAPAAILVTPLVANVFRSTNSVLLTWPASPDKTYQVLYKDDLLSSSWSTLAVPVSVTNSVANVIDTIVEGQPQRFYLIMER